MEVRDVSGRRRRRLSWPARVVASEEDRLVLYGDWERPLTLPDPEGQVVPVTNRSLEFYHRRKPYAIAALLGLTWELQEYYVRLIRPPRWDLSCRDPSPKTLRIERLGLDVRIRPDYEYEFIEHGGSGSSGSAERGISPEDEARLREGVFALLEELERREGPFDPDELREWVERARRM